MQDCSNSSALAMELLQSCTEPSICRFAYTLPGLITILCPQNWLGNKSEAVYFVSNSTYSWRAYKYRVSLGVVVYTEWKNASIYLWCNCVCEAISNWCICMIFNSILLPSSCMKFVCVFSISFNRIANSLQNGQGQPCYVIYGTKCVNSG